MGGADYVQAETYHLGSYDKIEDAIKAREKGEEMWADFLEWYYRTYPEKKPTNQCKMNDY